MTETCHQNLKHEIRPMKIALYIEITKKKKLNSIDRIERINKTENF